MQHALILLLLLQPLRVSSQRLHAATHHEMEEFLERRRMNGEITRTFLLTLVATVLSVALLAAVVFLWREHGWAIPSTSLTPTTPLFPPPPTIPSSPPPSFTDLARSRLSLLHVRLLRLQDSAATVVSATWNSVASSVTSTGHVISAKWNSLADIHAEARLTRANLRLLQRLKRLLLRNFNPDFQATPPTHVIPT